MSARARGCWGLLWPQHSSGSERCWGMPRSEPGLPAAPIEAEAVGTGSTLQPTARQEAPQGGAGTQVAAAAKVKALSAWPAPGAPGHLDGATGDSISVAPTRRSRLSWVSSLAPLTLPAYAHGLHSHWDLGPSWTSGGNG